MRFPTLTVSSGLIALVSNVIFLIYLQKKETPTTKAITLTSGLISLVASIVFILQIMV